MKNERGITLVALVIIIIILLILSGVSIFPLLGNNGILIQVNRAKESTETSKLKEIISLVWTECETEYQLENKENKTREEFFTEENFNSKIEEGSVSDFIYNEKEESFMLYHTDNGIKYNVKVANGNIDINQDSSSIEDLRNWKNCIECSEQNPHIIKNKYEFESIKSHINIDEDGKEIIDGYFKLSENIYFYNSDFEKNGYFYNNGEGFIPIGLKEGPYENLYENKAYNVKINFNGNNKEIVNVKINTKELQRDYNSIFARLDNGGQIKNLCINNLNISAPTSVGGIVRALYEGAELKNIILKNVNCRTTKNMGAMKSSGLVAGYIEGKVSNVKIYNSSFISDSWYGGGISGQISNRSDINDVIMDKCNIKTYVEGGMLAGKIYEGTKIKNVNILNSSYTYTHNDAERSGLLFYSQSNENKDNPAIFDNLNIKNVEYNENLKKIVGKGYVKLINSNLKLKNYGNAKLTYENVFLENSIIDN